MNAKNRELVEAPKKKSKIPVIAADNSQPVTKSPGLNQDALPEAAASEAGEGNSHGSLAAGQPQQGEPIAEKRASAASENLPPEPNAQTPQTQRVGGNAEPPAAANDSAAAGTKEQFSIGIDNIIYEKLRGYIVYHAARHESISSVCEDQIRKFITEFEKVNGPIKPVPRKDKMKSGRPLSI